MEQKLTVLFDLDGTLVDTAPDLIRAHNHVMKKFKMKCQMNLYLFMEKTFCMKALFSMVLRNF